jgi:hypothetical protein
MVDLPAPVCPTRATVSPGVTVNDTPAIASPAFAGASAAPAGPDSDGPAP